MRTVASFAAIALVSACSLGREQLAPGEPELVVHGVLSGTAGTQSVLLEWTHAGQEHILTNSLDPSDPVASDRGLAESLAQAQIERPDGSIVTGREPEHFDPGLGVFVRDREGIYVFQMSGASLTAGVYKLRFTTTGGKVVTAETRFPAASPAAASAARTFNRSTDTVSLQWAAAPGARGYLVRIDGPYGPMALLAPINQIRLTGDVRNVDVRGFPHVFFPGFRQQVTVTAVDSNYYDYVRTSMDLNSGSGLISRVQGGLGVFGSSTRVHSQPFVVTATQSDPIEGSWDKVIDPTFGVYFARGFALYVESRSEKASAPHALSGNYRFGLTNTATPPGVLGTMQGDSVKLVFLSGQNARLPSDTAEIFRGQLRGDTIVGKYRFGAPATFVKR